MVCRAFSASGKADLFMMKGNKTLLYISTCWKKVFPFMNRLDTNNTIFQQDNTSIHTSKLTKDWFKTKVLKFWTGPLSLQI